ncbi:ATP-binding protein [Chloroflexota bacterium]
MPVIDQEKCDSCGLCVSVCSCNALIMVKNTVTIVETEDCHWCLGCEVVCPLDAISCSFEIVIEEN